MHSESVGVRGLGERLAKQVERLSILARAPQLDSALHDGVDVDRERASVGRALDDGLPVRHLVHVHEHAALQQAAREGSSRPPRGSAAASRGAFQHASDAFEQPFSHGAAPAGSIRVPQSQALAAIPDAADSGATVHIMLAREDPRRRREQ
jgi:hypothetical protein